MKVKKIVYKNFLQHEDRTVKLSGNLVGVLGSNGSGKSNLVRGIRYALVGDVPGKRKEQLATWGTDKPGSVVVEFSHDGVDGVITRGVNGGRTHMKYGDREEKGITAVNNAVKELFDLDKDIAGVVFVEQAQLDSVLFETPAVREQAFQRMCGLSDAAKIQKYLGDVLAGQLQVAEDPAPYINILKKEIEETETNIATVSAQLETAGASEAVQGRISEAEETLADLRWAATAIQGMRTDEESLRAARLSLETSDTAAKSITAELEGRKSEASIDKNIDKLQRLLTDVHAYIRDAGELAKAENALAAVGPAPTTEAHIQALREEYDSRKAEVDGLLGQRSMYSGLLAKVRNGEITAADVCPLCGGSLDGSEKIEIQLDNRVTMFDSRIERIPVKEKLQEYTAARQSLDQWNATVTAADSSRAQLAASLEARAEVAKYAADGHIALIESKISELTADRAARKSAEIQLAGAQRDIENAKVQIAACEKRIGVFQGEFKSRDLDPATMSGDVAAKIHKLNTSLVNLRTERDEHARLSASKDLLTRRVQTMRGQLAEREQQRAGMAAIAKAREVVSNVRAWLHYSNGPRQVAGAILKDMTSYVNKFLEELNSPFIVAPDVENMSYNCQFSDGRAAPEDGNVEAAELSGGQKVMLAMAFRLASYCMFAHRQGLLSLDEPSAYLDDENVGNLKALLLKVHEIARKMGVQVFIPTHEKELIPCFDDLITV